VHFLLLASFCFGNTMSSTTSSPVEVSEPVTTAEPLSYKNFVREFMKSLSKSDVPLGRDRMKLCGEAWRERCVKSGHVQKKRAASAPPSRRKLLYPKQPTTLKEVSDFFVNLREEGHEDRPTFSRLPAFQVPRTKSVQSRLRQGVKKFSHDLKGGRIQSMEDAFTKGFNTFYHMAHSLDETAES